MENENANDYFHGFAHDSVIYYISLMNQQKTPLYLQLLEMQKGFTSTACTTDTLPSSEAIKELQIEYTNMLTAIIDLLDGAKYLWEGDCHE